jgi:predicted amidohydrolase
VGVGRADRYRRRCGDRRRRAPALLVAAAVLLVLPAGADAQRVRVFAVGPKLDVERWLDTRQHFHDKYAALLDRSLRGGPGVPLIQRGAGDVASRLLGPRDAARPARTARDLVALPEDAGFWAMLTGPRGEPARRQGSSVAAVASLAGTYAPQVNYYEAKFPQLAARGVPGRTLMLALTDTFARVAVETFAELADRHDVYLVAGMSMARDWQVVCADRESFNSAPPLPGGVRCSEESPAKVQALRDPSEPQREYAYEAMTGEPVNMALVFNPNGRLISKQVKAYLTPLELGGAGLDLKPGEVSGLDAVRTPVGAIGIVTSKDAWMPDVQAKLEQRGVDLLIQPEYFIGDTARPEGPWSADTLRASGYNNILRRPGFEAMVLSELTGNVADTSADQQSHIATRVRSRGAPRQRALIGQRPARGFEAVARWVVPDSLDRPIPERREALGRAGEALLPGSGVECADPARRGPCENGQVEQVLFADIRLNPAPRPRPYRGPVADTRFSASRPLAGSRHEQRNVDLASDGRRVVAAFEELHRGRGRVQVARSEDGGGTFETRSLRAGRQRGSQQWNPAVAVVGSRVICAWTQVRRAEQRVHLALSRDGGHSFGRTVAVPPLGEEPGKHTQWTPELAASGQGETHLVYLEEADRSADDSLPQTRVVYRRLGPGLSLGPPQRLDQGTPVGLAAKLDHSWAPDVAARGERVAVAWVDFRTYDWRPYARLSEDGGQSFGEELEVSDSAGQFERGEISEQLADSPSVAVSARRTHVAWADWRKEAITSERASRDYDTWLTASSDAEFGPEERLDDLGARQASSFWPALAAAPSGVLAAWQDSSGGTGDIRLTRVRRGGDPAGSMRVDDTGSSRTNQYRPSIAVSGRRALVAWEDERRRVLQIRLARAPIRRLG